MNDYKILKHLWCIFKEKNYKSDIFIIKIWILNDLTKENEILIFHFEKKEILLNQIIFEIKKYQKIDNLILEISNKIKIENKIESKKLFETLDKIKNKWNTRKNCYKIKKNRSTFSKKKLKVL